ncbi:GTP cyclohydrolase 1 feedback regulatory protein isoform X2 [Myotis lucifugus]|uniref:GTP cyclohydrolase 1 feedback regulatory protein isoform X2 n=1 Tax=Myotis lucifugus TaxID=59463 RepID=UPI000CCC2D2D|nr:GTP cyclohydrolase 1 feedback regulatory protein isoform X2 [Myotis lucifugus]
MPYVLISTQIRMLAQDQQAGRKERQDRLPLPGSQPSITVAYLAGGGSHHGGRRVLRPRADGAFGGLKKRRPGKQLVSSCIPTSTTSVTLLE